MNMQEIYEESFERYKHIEILPGLYKLKNKPSVTFEVLVLDDALQKATVVTQHSGRVATKTLHWCRKNLIRLEDEHGTGTPED